MSPKRRRVDINPERPESTMDQPQFNSIHTQVVAQGQDATVIAPVFVNTTVNGGVAVNVSNKHNAGACDCITSLFLSHPLTAASTTS